MKKVLIALALASAATFALSSCGGNANQQQSADSLQTQEADSAAACEAKAPAAEPLADEFPAHGTYKGTLPCADCPGLETTLTIEPDGAYTLTQEYEKKGEPGKFEYKGMATFSDGLITLPIDPADSSSYMILECAEPGLIMQHETHDSMTPEEEAMYHLLPME
ncbi:MAG: hypothetical protein CSA97_02515 [Bacteroidetes bacterium]|nr:MAG: hypothetical protein CSA97_02515 [Bacteroidota bacterium]